MASSICFFCPDFMALFVAILRLEVVFVFIFCFFLELLRALLAVLVTGMFSLTPDANL